MILSILLFKDFFKHQSKLFMMEDLLYLNLEQAIGNFEKGVNFNMSVYVDLRL